MQLKNRGDSTILLIVEWIFTILTNAELPSLIILYG